MIKLILLTIFVEAITEIIVTSSIFSTIREKIAKNNSFFGELFHCGYCMSVWVSMSIVWVAPLIICDSFVINYIISVFIIHRLSNLLHELFNKWLERRPLSFAIHKTETVLMPDKVFYTTTEQNGEENEQN